MSSGRTVTLSTGHKMPALGYGTWQAGPGEVANGIFEALKTGYRHLDLAKVYGNQREVAQGLQRAFAELPGLKREDIFITSKLWNTSHQPADVEAALDDTLSELKLDYLDPVSFKPGQVTTHDDAGVPEVALDLSVSIVQTWKAVTELPKPKVRSVGVSNFTIEQLEVIIKETKVVPAVNQIERHPRLSQPALMEYCASKKIIITAYSPFGNNSLGLPLLFQAPEVKAVAERLSKTQGKEITPAQVILAWSTRGGHTVIPKSVTPSRIRENFVDIELDDEAFAAVEKLSENPQRMNVPVYYKPRWNINVFQDPVEKEAVHKVILTL